jgi:hypothetical protein
MVAEGTKRTAPGWFNKVAVGCSAVAMLGVLVTLALIVLVFSISDESFESHYKHKAEASAEGLFEQGWLPELIPDSATNISVGGDLDSNHSSGEFSFDPNDAIEFISKLRTPDQLTRWEEDLARKEKCLVYRHSNDNFIWTFYINPEAGRCLHFGELID